MISKKKWEGENNNGIYLNHSNGGFAEINDSGYFYKTCMIDNLNQRINTLDKLVYVSSLRRFVKTIVTKMLYSPSQFL